MPSTFYVYVSAINITVTGHYAK